MGQKLPRATTKNNPTDVSQKQLTFNEHLVELRNRLFLVAIVLIAGTLLGYTFHKELAAFLMSPLAGQKLIYLTPSGGFDFIFKISFYFGIVITFPTIVYSIYKFLAPIMKEPRRTFMAFLIISSFCLAAAGIAFGYFVAVPSALHFLTTFAEDYVTANLTASSYLSFVTIYLLGLAALFQLPLILMIVNGISGPLKPIQLFKSQQYVFLGVFILAAIITPTPDIVNQLMVAGPILTIYQLGVIAVVIQNRRANRRQQKAQTAVVLEKTNAVKSMPVRTSIDNIPASVLSSFDDEILDKPKPNFVAMPRPKQMMDGFAKATPKPVQPVSKISNVSSGIRPTRPVSMDFVSKTTRPALIAPARVQEVAQPQPQVTSVPRFGTTKSSQQVKVYGTVDGIFGLSPSHTSGSM